MDDVFCDQHLDLKGYYGFIALATIYRSAFRRRHLKIIICYIAIHWPGITKCVVTEFVGCQVQETLFMLHCIAGMAFFSTSSTRLYVQLTISM